MSMDNETKALVVHNYYDEKVPASRYRRTVRYEAAKLSPEEYGILYELVTTNPFYSKKVELLRQVLKNYQFRKSCSNSPLPLVFKQAVYLLAYELCKGDYYNIAQKQVLRDIGLSLNSFTKWGMKPKNDFNAQLYLQLADLEPPTIIPLQYQGKKNMALIYLVSELSKQIPYNRFLDVFGGSGAVTVGLSKKENAKYYINDADPAQTNIYLFLRNQKEIFVKVISEIYEIINRLSKTSAIPDTTLNLFPEITVSEIIDRGNNFVISARETQRKNLHNTDVEYEKHLKKEHPDMLLLDEEERYERPSSYTKYNREVHNYLDKLEKLIDRVNALTDDLNYSEILYARGLFKYFDDIQTQPDSFSAQQRAVATIFQQSFSARHRADLSDSITVKTLKKICNNLNVWNTTISELEHYKINVFNELDVEVVTRKEINCKDTLLYLDSPYIATVGYKSVYGRKEFQALHDKLADFAGHWIFSCRVGVNYKSKPDKIPENSTKFMEKYDNIKFLLDLYSDIAQYVAFIRDDNVSDEYYLVHDGIKEVMFLNFSAFVPDINILRKLIVTQSKGKSKSIAGANKKSVYSIMSYKEFYPLAIKGLDPANWQDTDTHTA